MNKQIIKYKKSIENKKIAVIGLGISNMPLINFIYSNDSDITIFDKGNLQRLSENMKALSNLNIKYSLGKRLFIKVKRL